MLSRIMIIGGTLALWPSLASAAQDQGAPTFALNFELAPKMSLARPYTTADYEDATAASISLEAEHQLFPGVKGSLSFGPSLTFDDDNDPPNGSAISGEVGLATTAFGRWKFFSSYGVEASFTGHFDQGSDKTGTGKAGLKYERPLLLKSDLEAELAILRVDSSEELDEHVALSGEAIITSKLLGFADLKTMGGVQRQRYDQIEAGLGETKRRDWQFFGFIGLDFAPLVKRWIPGGHLDDRIKSLAVGYKYARTSSNIESKDSASHSFQPVVKLTTPL